MNCLRRVARNGSHSIRQKESAKIKTIYLMNHGETLFKATPHNSRLTA